MGCGWVNNFKMSSNFQKPIFENNFLYVVLQYSSLDGAQQFEQSGAQMRFP